MSNTVRQKGHDYASMRNREFLRNGGIYGLMPFPEYEYKPYPRMVDTIVDGQKKRVKVFSEDEEATAKRAVERHAPAAVAASGTSTLKLPEKGR